MKRGYAPLDQNCPAVAQFYQRMTEDPYSDMPGDVLSEIIRKFSRQHRAECSHCQEYGVANIEVGEA
jgi:hypothetical protein